MMDDRQFGGWYQNEDHCTIGKKEVMKKLAPPYDYLGEDDWSRKMFKTNTG